MAESKQAKIIMGILGVILILTNGTQYALNETGKTSRCYSGWEFQESGEHEGAYSCSTTSSVRYMYCSEVYNSSSGRNNFYCKEAIPVMIGIENPIIPGGEGATCADGVKRWNCGATGCVSLC